jgi:ParB family chromosome partitioning protein
MLDLASLQPNPRQPRREIGDITDLVASIKEKGVLEPILVRANEGAFEIIAGERRFHAARAAGLAQVPCIELEVDERGVLEISLIENLQRKDLDPFEEGDAIRELCDRFNYTHQKVAQKLGKSRTSITEILSIATIPEEVRGICRRADISSKTLLIEIARQPDNSSMLELLERIEREKLTRDYARKLRAVPPPETGASEEAETGRGTKPGFALKLKMERVPGTVSLRFADQSVKKSEVLSALRELISHIEASTEFPE